VRRAKASEHVVDILTLTLQNCNSLSIRTNKFPDISFKPNCILQPNYSVTCNLKPRTSVNLEGRIDTPALAVGIDFVREV
jgi:hypothetical protein